MLVLVAAWAVLSLLVGLAVSQAIRRADLPQVPARLAGRAVAVPPRAGPSVSATRSAGPHVTATRSAGPYVTATPPAGPPVTRTRSRARTRHLTH